MPKLPRLRTHRELEAMTQEELARLAGLSRATVSRVESGQSAFPGTTRKLPRALGLKPRELMNQKATDHSQMRGLEDVDGE